MIELFASLQIVLGVMYILVIGVWTLWDVWLEYRREGTINHLGVALTAMAVTCGPHHLHHGVHLLATGVFVPIDFAFLLVSLPWPFVFTFFRFMALSGKRGDWIFQFERAMRSHWALAIGIWALAVGTGVGWGWLLLTYGWPAYTAGPQYLLFVLYNAIAFMFYRVNAYDSIRSRHGSLNSMMLALLFATCASTHLVTGTLIGVGVYPATHLYELNSFGVGAAIMFLVAAIEKRSLHMS